MEISYHISNNFYKPDQSLKNVCTIKAKPHYSNRYEKCICVHCEVPAVDSVMKGWVEIPRRKNEGDHTVHRDLLHTGRIPNLKLLLMSSISLDKEMTTLSHSLGCDNDDCGKFDRVGEEKNVHKKHHDGANKMEKLVSPLKMRSVVINLFVLHHFDEQVTRVEFEGPHDPVFVTASCEWIAVTRMTGLRFESHAT